MGAHPKAPGPRQLGGGYAGQNLPASGRRRFVLSYPASCINRLTITLRHCLSHWRQSRSSGPQPQPARCGRRTRPPRLRVFTVRGSSLAASSHIPAGGDGIDGAPAVDGGRRSRRTGGGRHKQHPPPGGSSSTFGGALALEAFTLRAVKNHRPPLADGAVCGAA